MNLYKVTGDITLDVVASSEEEVLKMIKNSHLLKEQGNVSNVFIKLVKENLIVPEFVESKYTCSKTSLPNYK
jgi:hypothetical protein